MSNLNKVFLMGRLTRDPELKYTPNGAAVCDLGLAVNREYKAGNGERRKDVLFIDVTVWSRQAEVCAQYLSKGRPIFIEGRLSMDSWEGQDGQKRTKYRVVAENFQFLDGADRSEDRNQSPEQEQPGARQQQPLESTDSYGLPPGAKRETSYGDTFRQPGPEPADVGGDGGGAGATTGGPESEDLPF